MNSNIPMTTSPFQIVVDVGSVYEFDCPKSRPVRKVRTHRVDTVDSTETVSIRKLLAPVIWTGHGFDGTSVAYTDRLNVIE